MIGISDKKSTQGLTVRLGTPSLALSLAGPWAAHQVQAQQKFKDLVGPV